MCHKLNCLTRKHHVFAQCYQLKQVLLLQACSPHDGILQPLLLQQSHEPLLVPLEGQVPHAGIQAQGGWLHRRPSWLLHAVIRARGGWLRMHFCCLLHAGIQARSGWLQGLLS